MTSRIKRSRQLENRSDRSRVSYHDCIPLANDFEVVHAQQAREVHVGNLSRVVGGPRSPQRGRTSWTLGTSWVPEDNPNIALDPNGDWFNEEVEAPATADHPSHTLHPIKKIKSKVSVGMRCTFPLSP